MMQLDISSHLNFSCVTVSGFHVSTFASGERVYIESGSVSKKLHTVEEGQKEDRPCVLLWGL